MSSDRGEEFAFVCPNCDESLEVNGSMRAMLLERGCVICGAFLTRDAFTRTTSTEPS